MVLLSQACIGRASARARRARTTRAYALSSARPASSASITSATAPPVATAPPASLRFRLFCGRERALRRLRAMRAGLTPAALAEPDARVQYATAVRLGEAALEVTGDENFGLHLATDVRDVGSYDAATLLLMASPTVRVALSRMVAHQRYWGDGDRATLQRARGGLRIQYLLQGAEGAYARHADECAMAEMTIGVQVMTGRPLRPRLIRFRHGAPRLLDEHSATFGCPIEFDAARTEVVFDDAALDTPMQHANDAFFAIFEQQVQRALARLPAPTRTSEPVRAVVRGALAGGSKPVRLRRGRCPVVQQETGTPPHREMTEGFRVSRRWLGRARATRRAGGAPSAPSVSGVLDPFVI